MAPPSHCFREGLDELMRKDTNLFREEVCQHGNRYYINGSR